MAAYSFFCSARSGAVLLPRKRKLGSYEAGCVCPRGQRGPCVRHGTEVGHDGERDAVPGRCRPLCKGQVPGSAPGQLTGPSLELLEQVRRGIDVDDVVIIHHEPRPDGSRQMPEVGIVIPVHASALGKAMLAFLPDDAERVLTSGTLRSMTGETLTSPKELRAQLDEVRSTGIAIEQDEAVIGESDIASPVFDSWGTAVGAIGVVVPSGGTVSTHEARDTVREPAQALSRELGAGSWPPRPHGA